MERPTKPKRPLTAYNYFFHDERKRLLESIAKSTGSSGKRSVKVGFSRMAKIIAAKWKQVSAKQMVHYANLANHDKLRYRREMESFKAAEREYHEVHRQPETNVDIQWAICDDIYVSSFPIQASQSPSIEDLARKLDKDSIDIIVAALK